MARFVLEARAVNRIGHPNIVDVFSFGRLPDGRSYFVMEWLQGETLYERIWQQRGPLPLPDVRPHPRPDLRRARGGARKGHHPPRSQAGERVPVPGARARTTRSSCSTSASPSCAHRQPERAARSSGCVVGTPEYISPEQARGKDVDARTDLYALGVIAYEMVLGRLPFLSRQPG